MNISTWSIRHPVPSLAIFAILLVAGIISFRRLPVTQFPNIDLPIVTITVAEPGAAPTELTTQVIEPIEDSVAGITGLKHITSTATDSLATITAQFELNTPSQRAVSDVKDAVARIRSTLPGTITEPIIKRVDVTGRPILTYAISDPTRTIEDLSYFVDTVISRELQGVDGVGSVSRLGGAERQIKVELSPDRLLALGLTVAGVSQQLRAANVDLGGGRGTLAGQEFSIRALGGATTLAQLSATPIRISAGHTVRLDQLGQVIDGAAEARSFALFDGQPVVSFGIFRATGKSDLLAAEGSKAKLAELARAYPNVTIALIDDATAYTRSNYVSAMNTLYEGAALAVLVVLLFLRDWRATLIAAVALPLSAIPTFFVMDWLGFTLNTISLLGITLVTGILVDDAIVEIENIVRHIRLGKPAFEASEDAATEIGLTVIAISFTIVAVFAPVSFMSGIAGQYFKQFGLTVAVAVLFSLLVARTITPLLAAYFMRSASGNGGAGPSLAQRGYLHVLDWTLRNRGLTLFGGLGIFAASLYSATLMPTEFIPKADTGRSQISVELPPGATIGETRALSGALTRRLLAFSEVRSVFADGGSGGVTKANLTVNYGPRDTRKRSSFAIEADLRRALIATPDIRINFLGRNGRKDVTISVLGDTERVASDAAIALSGQMKALPELKSVSTSATLTRPEIRIRPLPEVAAQLGVSASTLANTVRIATIGGSDANLAKFNAGDRQIPIVVRMERGVRDNLVRMQGLRVPTALGKPVPLLALAKISLANGPSRISRYDRRFQTQVSANLAGGARLGPALASVYGLPLARKMPPGTAIKRTGNAEIMRDVFSSFGLAMGAGLMLVYVVLVLLFASFITPISILLSLPLAIGGAIFALYLGDYAIGLSVVIGFLMLMGIVTKNAIMLVAFAVESIDRGNVHVVAIRDAASKRARPIVMTTVAMTAGMVPSAIATTPGGEFRAPMAVAVIGGLLLSTALSLLFVPSLFSVIDALKGRLHRVLVRWLGINAPQRQADDGAGPRPG